MATAAQIPLLTYLKSSFRPDVEYIDGQLREKNMGQYEHSRIQALLAAWFIRHESLWRAIALTEQRLVVSPTRVRLPDVCLVPQGPTPDILTDPPILAIEILSPDDSYSELEERCRDYEALGVLTIWIIDPRTRTARLRHTNRWTETLRLEVPGTPIYADMEQLFADLDRSRQI
jgi:Uma2 family endonuclease